MFNFLKKRKNVMPGLTILTKEYSGEELHDVERDVSEAFDPDFNHRVIDIPQDDAEMQTGTFTVTITWEPADES